MTLSSARPAFGHEPRPAAARHDAPRAGAARRGAAPRIGLIHNARARHNINRDLPLVVAGCDRVMPLNHDELNDVLASFIDAGIDTLIVDGGDGTVRDVLSVMARDFPAFRPRIAVMPSGKTNALALDLGIPPGWTLAEAVDAAVRGREEERTPLEIWRDGADRADLSGFIFGAGAFVRATQMAQKAHRLGAFNGLAVGLSIAAAVGQTLFAGKGNAWRRGEMMRVASDAEHVTEAPQYLVLASTLRRMPLGIRPFGQSRPGLKMLRIAAPSSRILLALPAILTGANWGWLAKAGYHREDSRRIDVSLAEEFVLDGETFGGGALSLRQGPPLSFIVP